MGCPRQILDNESSTKTIILLYTAFKRKISCKGNFLLTPPALAGTFWLKSEPTLTNIRTRTEPLRHHSLRCFFLATFGTSKNTEIKYCASTILLFLCHDLKGSILGIHLGHFR